MSEHKPTYRITDLAASERPRERLEKHGPNFLSVAELLAILIRVGVEGENAVQVAQRLLQTFGGITGLHRATFEEVVSQHGLGPAWSWSSKGCPDQSCPGAGKPDASRDT